MTPEYEFAVYNKQDFLYRFAKDKPLAAPKPTHHSAPQPVAK
jgi:hypothetical protein